MERTYMHEDDIARTGRTAWLQPSRRRETGKPAGVATYGTGSREGVRHDAHEPKMR